MTQKIVITIINDVPPISTMQCTLDLSKISLKLKKLNYVDQTLLLSVNCCTKLPSIAPDHILKKYWFIYSQFSRADTSSAQHKIIITQQYDARKEYDSAQKNNLIVFQQKMFENNYIDEISANTTPILIKYAGIINNLFEGI
ncbi:Hypothetical_protein [Hexamita inflata]|uniref:Hypothetical_protein n=1 Tax=Hexamita inflata TaxID=28002 RepID=A0AA86THX1_9EUKA|nr:Hypothetical protein HINF_LOCUS6764 [Hexamita inflata]